MEVLRRNHDGTFRLRREGGGFLAEWEGVTRDEISIDDEALWPVAFDALRGTVPDMGLADVAAALRRAGVVADERRLADLWMARARQLFDAPDASALRLDRDQAYRFFRSVGLCARALADPGAADPSRDLYKLYWNGVRMGGRRPEDVGRAIDVDDALAAYGLADAPQDAAVAAALARFAQRERLALPRALTALWSRENALEVLRRGQCNNPEPQRTEEWTLARRGAPDAWEAPFAVRVMLPHQGDHAWWVLFERDAEDGEVWLSFDEDGRPARRVARSVAFFFWDLRQTSLAWGAEAAARES